MQDLKILREHSLKRHDNALLYGICSALIRGSDKCKLNASSSSKKQMRFSPISKTTMLRHREVMWSVQESFNTPRCKARVSWLSNFRSPSSIKDSFKRCLCVTKCLVLRASPSQNHQHRQKPSPKARNNGCFTKCFPNRQKRMGRASGNLLYIVAGKHLAEEELEWKEFCWSFN